MRRSSPPPPHTHAPTPAPTHTHTTQTVPQRAKTLRSSLDPRTHDPTSKAGRVERAGTPPARQTSDCQEGRRRKKKEREQKTANSQESTGAGLQLPPMLLAGLSPQTRDPSGRSHRHLQEKDPAPPGVSALPKTHLRTLEEDTGTEKRITGTESHHS